MGRIAAFVLAFGVFGAAARAEAASASLATLALGGQWQEIQKRGPVVLPELVALYEQSDEAGRASVAQVFYNLGWKSEEAKRALLRDVHTKNQKLRLQVQWALGRVSDDPMVVDVLLENLQDDENPLFRDKAACALAYDQIHLTPAQKIRLYEGLIRALDDPKQDVRWASITALDIHLKQKKGYDPAAPIADRRRAIALWEKWLEEYKAQY